MSEENPDSLKIKLIDHINMKAQEIKDGCIQSKKFMDAMHVIEDKIDR